MTALVSPKPGALKLLRAAAMAGTYRPMRKSSVTAVAGLVKAGWLAGEGDGYGLTPEGRAALDGIDAAAEAAVPAVVRDMFGLVATVERARRALDEGDVIAAKMLAAGAYQDAKGRAAYAAQFGDAGKRVIAKARTLQGDALLIETRARMSIAAAYDQAQADGKAAKQGRPKNVADDDIFTQGEAGLTRQDIYAARKLLEREAREPGFAEKAVAARVAAGLEPSRASLKASIGTKTATKDERGHDLYQTGPEAIATLLALERFDGPIWEPACGPGAIVRALEAAGHAELILSDIVDYGTADQWGECQAVGDFLTMAPPERDVSIVTNPPFGIAAAFAAHALRVIRPKKMALLLNYNFPCGFQDSDREYALESCPPRTIHVFKHRLPTMHREDWDGPKASSSMNTAWFVWERGEDGHYHGRREINRVDWADFHDGSEDFPRGATPSGSPSAREDQE